MESDEGRGGKQWPEVRRRWPHKDAAHDGDMLICWGCENQSEITKWNKLLATEWNVIQTDKIKMTYRDAAHAVNVTQERNEGIVEYKRCRASKNIMNIWRRKVQQASVLYTASK